MVLNVGKCNFRDVLLCCELVFNFQHSASLKAIFLYLFLFFFFFSMFPFILSFSLCAFSAFFSYLLPFPHSLDSYPSSFCSLTPTCCSAANAVNISKVIQLRSPTSCSISHASSKPVVSGPKFCTETTACCSSETP